MDFTFARKFYEEPPPPDFERETVLGFKRKGRWFHGFDVDDCPIGPEGVGELLTSVRDWARAAGYQGFDSRTHEGLLKLLLVREGKRTGERMVVLVTGPGAFKLDGFVEAVRSAWPAASVQHAVSDSPAGVAFSEETTVLAGAGTIDEALELPGTPRGRLTFRVSPFSFFQTNTLATERLYAHIREQVAAVRPRRLLDLYGGSGGIALTCADLAGEVVSVENVEAASADGRFNAERNGAGNVRFETEKVKNYLKGLLAVETALESGAVAVVDPPRAGMHPKALRRLVELGPPVVVYVSCKPEVFGRDELPAFLERYALRDVRAFDLFPHTPHVELVSTLVRRDA
jgi:23S rRNA (uracil1939-C5)-methyltransferase